LEKLELWFGFVLGNAILTYLSTGNLSMIIYFREIFIAALGLLLVPANFKIDIEDLIGKEKYFPSSPDNRLGYYEDVKEKLNTVVNVISDMNSNFSISGKEDCALNEEIYLDNFLKAIDEYQENIFYEDVINNEELIRDIYKSFKEEDIITENIMLDIFKKYNNYVLLRDKKLKDDLQELIKIANRTYRELQIKKIKVDTKKEDTKKIKNELKSVTNIIKDTSEKITNENSEYKDKEKEIEILLKNKAYDILNVQINKCQNGKMIVKLELEYKDESIRDKSKILNIADIISKSIGTRFSFQKDRKNLSTGAYFQVYSSEDKYSMQVGSSKINKDGNSISGDSNLQIRLEDGKYLLAISDGMGSGDKAKENSKFVINTLNRLMVKGFENVDVLNLINSDLNLKKNSESYATVDMSILDLYLGEMLIIKNGACNTYVKNKKNVSVYTSKEMPVGLVDDVNLNEEVVKLNEGDIILMCSDGLLESKDEVRKDWIEEFLKNVNTNNVQRIADLIVGEAVDNSFGMVKDDITVIVAKIIKRK
jgi:stage II sporulation protein E